MKHITLTSILCLSALAAVLSLAAAFTAQYIFGLIPCELCLLQRVPYALIIMLAVFGLWRLRFNRIIIILISILFLVDAGIATYHSAVEKKLVQGPTGCTVQASAAYESDDDFLKKIKQAPVVACDQPAWSFHGITMAMLNAVWAACLGLITFAALQHNRKKNMYA